MSNYYSELLNKADFNDPTVNYIGLLYARYLHEIKGRTSEDFQRRERYILRQYVLMELDTFIYMPEGVYALESTGKINRKQAKDLRLQLKKYMKLMYDRAYMPTYPEHEQDKLLHEEMRYYQEFRRLIRSDRSASSSRL